MICHLLFLWICPLLFLWICWICCVALSTNKIIILMWTELLGTNFLSIHLKFEFKGHIIILLFSLFHCSIPPVCGFAAGQTFLCLIFSAYISEIRNPSFSFSLPSVLPLCADARLPLSGRSCCSSLTVHTAKSHCAHIAHCKVSHCTVHVHTPHCTLHTLQSCTLQSLTAHCTLHTTYCKGAPARLLATARPSLTCTVHNAQSIAKIS